MQNRIAGEQLWEKLNLLSEWQQTLVLRVVNSLLETQLVVGRRDKRRLLSLSVWRDEDIQRIEDGVSGVAEPLDAKRYGNDSENHH